MSQLVNLKVKFHHTLFSIIVAAVAFLLIRGQIYFLIGKIVQILYVDIINYPYQIFLWVNIWAREELITIVGGVAMAVVMGWYEADDASVLFFKYEGDNALKKVGIRSLFGGYKAALLLPLFLGYLALITIAGIFFLIGIGLGILIPGMSLEYLPFAGIALAAMVVDHGTAHLLIIILGNIFAAVIASFAVRLIRLPYFRNRVKKLPEEDVQENNEDTKE